MNVWRRTTKPTLHFNLLLMLILFEIESMEDFVRKRKSRKASVIACHRSVAGFSSFFCPCGSCDWNIMILFRFRFFSPTTFMRHRSAIAKTKRNSISVCHTSTSNPIIEKPNLTHGDRIFCLPFANARCENTKRSWKIDRSHSIYTRLNTPTGATRSNHKKKNWNLNGKRNLEQIEFHFSLVVICSLRLSSAHSGRKRESPRETEQNENLESNCVCVWQRNNRTQPSKLPITKIAFV